MNKPILSDDIVIQNARLAVKEELRKKNRLQQPIAKFNLETGEVYMETRGGNKRVVGKAMQRGRYSERRK